MIFAPNDRRRRRRDIIAQAMSLGREITAQRKLFNESTDPSERNIYRLRIRALQRQWLSKIHILAKEYHL